MSKTRTFSLDYFEVQELNISYFTHTSRKTTIMKQIEVDVFTCQVHLYASACLLSNFSRFALRPLLLVS